MDIEERLRKDGARFKEMSPPEELSARLRSALNTAKPRLAPRPWLRLGASLATAAAIGLLLFGGNQNNSAKSGEMLTPPVEIGPPEIESDYDYPGGQENPGTNGDEADSFNESVREEDPLKTGTRGDEATSNLEVDNPPISNTDRDSAGKQDIVPGKELAPMADSPRLPTIPLVLFTGLGIVAGSLWFLELKGRKRMVFAIVVPLTILLIGYLWLMRHWLF